jgi:hypothetical protein
MELFDHIGVSFLSSCQLFEIAEGSLEAIVAENGAQIQTLKEVVAVKKKQLADARVPEAAEIAKLCDSITTLEYRPIRRRKQNDNPLRLPVFRIGDPDLIEIPHFRSNFISTKQCQSELCCALFPL